MNRILLQIKLDRYIKSLWKEAPKDIGEQLEKIVNEECEICKRKGEKK